MRHYTTKLKKPKTNRQSVNKVRVVKAGNRRRTIEVTVDSANRTATESVPTTTQTHVRKTKKTGSSIQTTIPVSIVKKLDIHPGDNVRFIETEEGDILLKKEEKPKELSKDFLLALQEGMSEYDDALKSLVDR